MQAVTKMADLTRFRQTDVGQIGDVYANYVTRDIPDMLANFAILAIFMQLMSSEISLTCWRIWRFWRFLCKLCHQRYPWHVGEFCDFGDFYANNISWDGPNMLANMTILASFMLINSWVIRVEQKASNNFFVLK